MSSTTVTVTCSHCGRQVEKDLREVRRAERLGRRLFCSLSCVAQASNSPRKSKVVTLEMDQLSATLGERVARFK